MVHSRRRHGLYSSELEAVTEAIKSRLRQLSEERYNLTEATILFRVLFRIKRHYGKPNSGKCRYPPEIDWKLIDSTSHRIFIAGGITPDNVIEAAETGVYGIDICSGIEASPGKKDHKKMKQLFDNIRLIRGQE